MTPWRTALLGFGNSGRHYHAPHLLRSPAFDLRAVARARPQEPSVQGVDFIVGWENVLAQGGLDVVVVALPHDLHVPAAEAALDLGAHVLLEKPVALHARDARRLATKARKNGLVLMAHHQRRWEPDFCHLERLIHSGAVGTPWRIVVTRSHQGDYALTAPDRPHSGEGLSEWAHQRQRGGGVGQLIAPHSVDHLLRLARDDVQSVDARAHRARGEDVEDWIAIDITFSSGLTGTVEAFRRSGSAPPRFVVYGTEGTAVITDGTTVRVVRRGMPDLQIDTLGPAGTLGEEIYDDFAAAIEHGTPDANFQHAIDVVEVLEQADSSLVGKGILDLRGS